ncbi:MAG: hypothetical protein ACTSO7_05160 [Candidatus Heimdallarchaeota archaeon]
MVKQHRSKLVSKPFLYYLLIIFLFTGIFVSIILNTSISNAKIANPDNSFLHSNSRDLHNYKMESKGYDWISSSPNSRILPLSDDDAETVTLPFTFPFYDEEFTRVYVSSNGWFSFTNPNPDSLSIVNFPSPSSTYYYSGGIFMCDLYPSNNIYVHETDDFLAIEYRSIDYYGGSTAGTFEVVFFKNGIIKFQFNQVDNMAHNPSIGLNYGLDIKYYNDFNDLTISHDDFALTFTYPGTYTGLIIGISVGGGLVLIGGVIGVFFLVRYRKRKAEFMHDEKEFPLIYRDYVSLEQEAIRILSPTEKSILLIQDKIRELFEEYRNKDVILLDVLAEQLDVDNFLVEEAFDQLIAAEEIKGKLNIIAKEFVVKK